jgi:hypothetical protein
MGSTAETIGRYATRSRRVPSRIWYWVAAAVVVLGIGGGVVWGVVSTVRTHDLAESLPRTDAPGTVETYVGSGGSQLIYFEGEGRPGPDALGLSVLAPDGSSVRVEPYDAIMKYDIAGWVGTPIASFSAQTAGTYTVLAESGYHEGRISAGDNFIRTQAIDIVGALALIAASLVAGTLIVIVVAVKRSRRDGTASQAGAVSSGR